MKETIDFYHKSTGCSVVAVIYRGTTCARGDDPTVVLSMSAVDFDGEAVTDQGLLERLHDAVFEHYTV